MEQWRCWTPRVCSCHAALSQLYFLIASQSNYLSLQIPATFTDVPDKATRRGRAPGRRNGMAGTSRDKQEVQIQGWQAAETEQDSGRTMGWPPSILIIALRFSHSPRPQTLPSRQSKWNIHTMRDISRIKQTTHRSTTDTGRWVNNGPMPKASGHCWASVFFLLCWVMHFVTPCRWWLGEGQQSIILVLSLMDYSPPSAWIQCSTTPLSHSFKSN